MEREAGETEVLFTIVRAFYVDGKPANLAASNLLELRFPTLTRAGNQQQDQSIPHFHMSVLRSFHVREHAKYVLSWLVGFVPQPKILQAVNVGHREFRAVCCPVVGQPAQYLLVRPFLPSEQRDVARCVVLHFRQARRRSAGQRLSPYQRGKLPRYHLKAVHLVGFLFAVHPLSNGLTGLLRGGARVQPL